MARGRVLDKTIHLNEDLSKCVVEARYLYKALIIHSDDEGRMKASSKFLKGLIFPFDDAIRINTIEAWRNQLVSSGLIKLYVAGDQEYLSHPNWKKWQPIREDRAKPSNCPSPNSKESQILDGMTTKRQPDDNQPPPIPNPTLPNPTLPNPIVSAKAENKPEKTKEPEKQQDKPYEKPTDPLGKMVLGWKLLQGYQLEDRSWDKAHWGRTAKCAKSLLEFFSGDHRTAMTCMAEIKKKMDRLNLSCTMETIQKHSAEWRIKNEQLANQN